jgi:threonine synthase
MNGLPLDGSRARRRPGDHRRKHSGWQSSIVWLVRSCSALERNGTAVAGSDAEILETQNLTGRLAGVFAGPAAATSVAAARKLRDGGVIGPGDTVICNLTGYGLKQPEAIRLSQVEVGPIAPTILALCEKLKQMEI